jgi:uncharacterized membrane protein HdeD (DUF308 family)
MTDQGEDMSKQALERPNATDPERWLKTYYLLRGAVSIVWVSAALLVEPKMQMLEGALLIAYPAWDALANVIDARKSGGLKHSPTQSFNAFVSVVTTAAVAVALTKNTHVVLAVFGVWAALAGLLQLATAVRRWKGHGAQWLMVLSGAQSAVAGANFLHKATVLTTPGAADVAPYAAFGAFYFLVAAGWLVVSAVRRQRRATTA